LKNMLDISESVTRAAIQRTESRGAHTREDHPGSDDEWGKVNCIVRQRDGNIMVEREPLPQVPDEIKEMLEE
jgi:succinate dehydrogenase / fumarate reductase flavoprotein subunit